MKHTLTYILAVCLLFCTGCTAQETNSAPDSITAESTEIQTEKTPETSAETETEIPTTVQTETDLPAQTEAETILTPDAYSVDALCEMALDYYEGRTGYRPSLVTGEMQEDGMVLIHLYDDMGTHTVTSDWYTVDPLSAVGTNVMMETIDLKSPPEAMTEVMDALAGICMADGESEEVALDTAAYMREKAQELSGTTFGEITSEADAIAKGRDVLLLIGAGDSVERAESDYVEIDGELVKYERDGDPWYVEHFPEYDAWRVTPALPCGVTEDGRKIGAPGLPPYVILRGADGAVMGVFH